jgi:hypothetical protein
VLRAPAVRRRSAAMVTAARGYILTFAYPRSVSGEVLHKGVVRERLLGTGRFLRDFQPHAAAGFFRLSLQIPAFASKLV